MFFMARAAPPMLPGWLVLTRTTRIFCSTVGALKGRYQGGRSYRTDGRYAMKANAALPLSKNSAKMAGFLL
jgi:hypothetical protein